MFVFVLDFSLSNSERLLSIAAPSFNNSVWQYYLIPYFLVIVFTTSRATLLMNGSRSGHLLKLFLAIIFRCCLPKKQNNRSWERVSGWINFQSFCIPYGPTAPSSDIANESCSQCIAVRSAKPPLQTVRSVSPLSHTWFKRSESLSGFCKARWWPDHSYQVCWRRENMSNRPDTWSRGPGLGTLGRSFLV